MLRQPGIPGRHVAAQTVIKECQRRIPQRLRHATVKGLGDTARDGGLRVAVAPQPDGVAHGLLEGMALQEGDDGFGDGFLAAFLVAVGGSDPGQGAVQVIAVAGGDIITDGIPSGAVPGQEYGRRRGAGPFDALGMVMRHGGAQGRILLGLLQAAAGPAHGRDAHGRAVAETVVRLAAARDDPAEKTLSVPRPDVRTPIFVHGVDEGLPAGLLLTVGPHQGPAHGHGHHRIVREAGTGREQGKGLGGPPPGMELVRTAHHVTDDGSQHDSSPW